MVATWTSGKRAALALVSTRKSATGGKESTLLAWVFTAQTWKLIPQERPGNQLQSVASLAEEESTSASGILGENNLHVPKLEYFWKIRKASYQPYVQRTCILSFFFNYKNYPCLR